MMMSDLFDMITLDHCDDVFYFVEERVATWKMVSYLPSIILVVGMNWFYDCGFSLLTWCQYCFFVVPNGIVFFMLMTFQ